MDGLNTSIIGRAIEAGLLEINAVNIRDYSTNKHMKVDDYPYGGGAGMVMQAEPVYLAYESVQKKLGYRPRVVYLTPQGEVFHQTMAKELAKGTFPVAAIPAAIPIILHSAIPQSM